ncbi:glycoside hydrolase family 32 protein [Flavobacterium cellulosilyticum]
MDKEITNEELYRPNFHFTPKTGWMNDPNGMFFYKGLYHLYFQYYPDDTVWGPMHWGHATSTDMITWNEEKIALYPDEMGYIFSGSAVVDVNNTSGFGSLENPPIIAMFTYHNMEKEKAGEIKTQSQAIAYSLDEGMTWTKYEANPVIENPNIKDFRDPKMSWDPIHKQWLMVLAAGDRTMFYTSKNLKEWTLQSDFGSDIGAHGGVWECPDFFPIKIEGSTKTKWVLLQSINPGGPNGGSATQYFVGDFNGKTFSITDSFANDLKQQKALWIDFGKDNYAGVTWSNIPDTDGRKLFMGWMSNWEYANEVPTEKWRSAMTIPRELKLFSKKGKYRVYTLPVRELSKYVSKTIKIKTLSVKSETTIAKAPSIDLTAADISFTLEDLKEDIYLFKLHNLKGEFIEFGLNNKEHFFFIDRSKSGKTTFSEKFASGISKVKSDDLLSQLEVRLIIDKNSIEVFYNNGETVMTELFFSNAPMNEFSMKTEKYTSTIKNITINQLKLTK